MTTEKTLTETTTPATTTPATTPKPTTPATTKKRSRKTTPATTYNSLTPGDKSYNFTPKIRDQFNKQYPGLLSLIDATGFTSGREFGLYFRHAVTNDRGRKTDIITFVSGPGTKKNLAAKRPATVKFNAAQFKKSYPKLAAYFAKFTDVIFILTYRGRSDFRGIHYSFKF